jgi:hypothetical protein
MNRLALAAGLTAALLTARPGSAAEGFTQTYKGATTEITTMAVICDRETGLEYLLYRVDSLPLPGGSTRVTIPSRSIMPRYVEGPSTTGTTIKKCED